MKRVVADWLPMEDPAHEAKRIVRSGMSSIIDSFSDEVWEDWFAEAGPVYWGGPTSFVEQGPPMIDVVVVGDITFVSAQVERVCQQVDDLQRYYSQRYALGFSLPQSFVAGFPFDNPA